MTQTDKELLIHKLEEIKFFLAGFIIENGNSVIQDYHIDNLQQAISYIEYEGVK